jgi:hypothetical protein
VSKISRCAVGKARAFLDVKSRNVNGIGFWNNVAVPEVVASASSLKEIVDGVDGRSSVATRKEKNISSVIFAVSRKRRKTKMRIDFNQNTLIVTLYDDNNLPILLASIAEMERYLCKKISLDFNGTSEIFIDVDDYYEYTTYRRLLLDFCPIY